MVTQSIDLFGVNNLMYIIIAMGTFMAILFVIVIWLWKELSSLKRLHKEMMMGVDGTNLEQTILKCIEKTKAVEDECSSIKKANQQISDLLQKAITRVGVIRFTAFEGMGSDLSYSVAMLDSDNNGVIFSSIFGREESRNYLKPVIDGQSTYPLSGEEEQALREAMAK